jgi:hypothetical protein
VRTGSQLPADSQFAFLRAVMSRQQSGHEKFDNLLKPELFSL